MYNGRNYGRISPAGGFELFDLPIINKLLLFILYNLLGATYIVGKKAQAFSHLLWEETPGRVCGVDLLSLHFCDTIDLTVGEV